MASDLIERLRHADQHSVQRCLGSRIFGEAAEALAAKDAEIAALKAQLAEQPGMALPAVDLEACAEAVFQANDTWDGTDDHDERLALAVIRLVRPDFTLE